VNKACNKSFLLLVVPVVSITAILSTAGWLAAQQPAAKASVTLQPYTAPDQSASAGVPSGWQVTKGAETVIQMTGPQGETVFLGNTIVAKNGAFQAGQRGANGIDLSMPYNAPLTQKLTMIFQQNAAISGKPAPQVTFTSATPIQVPPILGQCGRFVASSSADQGPVKLMGVYCSFPVDSGGAYKNVLLLAQAPTAVAAQSAPIAQAIFQSYRIPPAMLQRKLAPFYAPPPPMPPGGGGGGMNPSTLWAEQSTDTMANCFDLSILRDTPNHDLPRSCGGSRPD
jgi:hypothetical protein